MKTHMNSRWSKRRYHWTSVGVGAVRYNHVGPAKRSPRFFERKET